VRRARLLTVFNLLYFSAIFVAALVAGFLFPPSLYEGGSSIFGTFVFGDPVVTVFWIFAFNLVLSAFVVVTLSGLAFFPLSTAALLVRAVLWGLLIYPLPAWAFLAALPTLILEGEAYVFAGVAGTTLGMSWLKPRWAYREESGLSRWSALKRAYGEFKRVYFVVAVLLFVAAIAETLTIAYL
jgi:hypothetical protein